MDTTFSPRRYELFDTTPPSKNTILINGVGVTGNSTVTTQPVRLAGAVGFRMEATAAMGVMRDGPAARFCGRLFLLIRGRAALILDRVDLPHVGRVESRMHTLAHVQFASVHARLTGQRHSMHVSYACDVPASLHRAIAPQTPPGPEATMLRWCTQGQVPAATLATLLCPGRGPSTLSLATRGGRITIAASGRGWHWSGSVSPRLR
jgi:hypothetical protein